MDYRTHPSERHLIPLSEIAETTSVPAAAIDRYIDLRLLCTESGPGPEELFFADQVSTIVVLRILELLGRSPQQVRALLEDRSRDPVEFDQLLHSRLHSRGSLHPEMSLLLHQLPQQ